jgi:hypothetical protein
MRLCGYMSVCISVINSVPQCIYYGLVYLYMCAFANVRLCAVCYKLIVYFCFFCACMRLYHFAGGCAARYVLVIVCACVYVHRRCVCVDVYVCTRDPLCPCWYMYCFFFRYIILETRDQKRKRYP